MTTTLPIAGPAFQATPNDPEKRTWLIATGAIGGIGALATASGGVITVAAEDLSLGGANLAGLTAASSIGSVAQATAYVGVVQTAITKTNSSLGQLGTGATALQNQLTFVQNLQDTLDTGIGNLVNANLGKESAQLTALQTKQQLGIQALSIANQSSSVLLSLFR